MCTVHTLPPRLSLFAQFGVCLLFALLNTSANAASLTISELEDINFGEVPTSANRVRERMRFCVTMTPPGPFQLTAYGTTSGASFALLDMDNVAAPIRFDLQVTRGPRARRSRTMLPGLPVRNLRAIRPRADGSCRRVGQLEVRVQINPQDLAAASAGRYRGQLQLTVAPE